MTTIALKDMKIAYDSNTTDGCITTINTTNKMLVDSDFNNVYFTVGHVESYDGYLDIFKEHKDIWHKNFSFKKQLKNNENYSSVTFLVVNYNSRTISSLEFNPHSYENTDEVSYSNLILPLDVTFAIGSGRQFAYGVMDHGGIAKEAVEITSIRDIYTGGKVNEVDLVLFGKETFAKDLLYDKYFELTKT